MIVKFDQPTIRFFRELSYAPFVDGTRRTSPVELSGVINLSTDASKVESIQIWFGDQMGSSLPQGALTFHCHTVPTGESMFNFMSTDVPSPMDLVSVGLAIAFHGAKEHLVFTPHYVYTISLYAETLQEIQKQSASMPYKQLEQYWIQKMEGIYNQLLDKHGRNFGTSFSTEWLTLAQGEGFNVHQFHQGDDVVFELGTPRSMNEDVTWDNERQLTPEEYSELQQQLLVEPTASERAWLRFKYFFTDHVAFMVTLGLFTALGVYAVRQGTQEDYESMRLETLASTAK
uniref:DNA repair protein RadC-like protein n=1 Tax=Clandestinovirus TaxID=2831644 RepID=A0A8F8PK23_9VIRU|nr:DNA repair protein RadC-like protein [Clandestinovirus]